jgi:hypothetical protein
MIDKDFLYDGLRFLQTNRSFLGREFLTWLWFVSETEKHKVTIPDLGEFLLYVDDRIVLSSSGGSVHENVLKGGTPAYAYESQTALRSGKLVDEAKFILQTEDRQWMWTMKAEDLSIRGVRLPSVLEGNAAAHMLERIALTRTLVDVLDHLFQRFMGIRLSEGGFQNELGLVSEWMHSKSSHATY